MNETSLKGSFPVLSDASTYSIVPINCKELSLTLLSSEPAVTIYLIVTTSPFCNFLPITSSPNITSYFWSWTSSTKKTVSDGFTPTIVFFLVYSVDVVALASSFTNTFTVVESTKLLGMKNLWCSFEVLTV